MFCLVVNAQSPREISVYILMSLANKYPCVLVLLRVLHMLPDLFLPVSFLVSGSFNSIPSLFSSDDPLFIYLEAYEGLMNIKIKNCKEH